MKKYEITDETQEFDGHILHRICVCPEFFDKVGDDPKGGWIESEKNLSHKGTCWIADDAKVFDNARIQGNANISGNAIVSGMANVFDHAIVCGNAQILDNSYICGCSKIFGNAIIKDSAFIDEFVNISENATLEEIKAPSSAV